VSLLFHFRLSNSFIPSFPFLFLVIASKNKGKLVYVPKIRILDIIENDTSIFEQVEGESLKDA
jgi:hypothetical protein